MEQGAHILAALLEELSRLPGVVSGLYMDALTRERLATLSATRLPAAIVGATLPREVGRWTASGRERTLLELDATAALAMPLPAPVGARAAGRESHDTLQRWAQRLQSCLEGEAVTGKISDWRSLVVEVAFPSPPISLQWELGGCVAREMRLRFVSIA